LTAIETTLAAIETKLATVLALVGVTIALTIGVLWLGFVILSRLPQL
jgi:hypothetical protein